MFPGGNSITLRLVLNPFMPWADGGGSWVPWLFLAVFLAASFLLLWRLEALTAAGFHGTLLGALVMPYCTGLGNLIFAFILGRNGGSGGDVMVNSLVNNLTNFTVVLGLPALIWGVNLESPPREQGKGAGEDASAYRRLDVLFTLVAALFFAGFTWVLGRKGRLDFTDGLILTGLFLFWQSFHVYETLRTHVRQGKLLHWRLPLELLVVLAAAYGIYVSTGGLVEWVRQRPPGFLSHHMGWLSGWLMVLPNAVLALYYGWHRKSEVVYASQVGDAHISIPLCLGVFALFRPIALPGLTLPALQLLGGVIVFHLLLVGFWGKLPRLVGLALIGAYVYFVFTGWGK